MSGRIKQFYGVLTNGFLGFFHAIFFVLTSIVTLVVGVFYTIMIFPSTSDGAGIIQGGVAVCAAVSGLCFAMAGISNLGEDSKDRIAYVGERLLHSTVLFALALILKYAVASVEGLEGPEWLVIWETEIEAVLFPVRLSMGMVFFTGVLEAHTAVVVLQSSLWRLKKRRPEWDSMWE